MAERVDTPSDDVQQGFCDKQRGSNGCALIAVTAYSLAFSLYLLCRFPVKKTTDLVAQPCGE